eukprot:215885-Amphidinium_carterae.2
MVHRRYNVMMPLLLQGLQQRREQLRQDATVMGYSAATPHMQWEANEKENDAQTSKRTATTSQQTERCSGKGYTGKGMVIGSRRPEVQPTMSIIYHGKVNIQSYFAGGNARDALPYVAAKERLRDANAQ